MSRGFLALKVFLSLKQIGVERYSRLLERNVALVEYLDELVRKSAEFVGMSNLSTHPGTFSAVLPTPTIALKREPCI